MQGEIEEIIESLKSILGKSHLKKQDLNQSQVIFKNSSLCFKISTNSG